MAFEFFKVPVHAPCAFADELNAFIAGHRVASVRKKFIRKKQKEGPSLKRLGYRRLSLRDLNCAKGAEVVDKNRRALRALGNARIGASLFGRRQKIGSRFTQRFPAVA
jgi:hypothetical protein